MPSFVTAGLKCLLHLIVLLYKSVQTSLAHIHQLKVLFLRVTHLAPQAEVSRLSDLVYAVATPLTLEVMRLVVPNLLRLDITTHIISRHLRRIVGLFDQNNAVLLVAIIVEEIHLLHTGTAAELSLLTPLLIRFPLEPIERIS